MNIFKKIILFSIAMILCVLISCNKQENEKEITPQVKVKELVCKKSELPINIDYKGKIFQCKKWIDSNGENYLILTTEEIVERERKLSGFSEYYKSLSWHGYHYCNNNGTDFKLIREFVDYIKDCEFDLMFEYMQDYIKISDLDNNNIGEFTVIYQMTCASDVSPWEIKLLMFENGNKYSIRGTTKVDYDGGESYGGEKFIDNAFKKGPQEFLNYAEVMFDRASGLK